MTKAKKTTLLVILGLVFALALTLVATSTTAFAATAAEPTGYYFKVGGQVVQNEAYPLRRGETSGEITYWYNGVQQPITQLLIMPQTIAVTTLTLSGNNMVTANKDAQLSYTIDNTPYVACISTNGLSSLYFQILPDDDIKLYNTGAGPFTFTFSGLDVQTIDGVSEIVNLNLSVTNSVGGIANRSISTTSTSEVINLNAATFSGYFLSGSLSVDLVSVTYSYGKQSITYSANDYPEFFGQQTVSVYTYFTGGNGSASDPYTVSNFRQLDYIRYTAFYDYTIGDSVITSNFKLISDIKLDVSPTATLFQPITAQFKGTLDGNNHTISNLYLTQKTYVSYYGLFAKIASTGVVKNLTMANVTVDIRSGSSLTVGSIAAVNYGTISNCMVSSSSMYVNAHDSFVGGVVGYNVGGKILYCTSTIDVDGCGNIGGIAGVNSSAGGIEYCHNYGNIVLELIEESGNYYTGSAGGVVGYNNGNAEIKNCSNNGLIWYVGTKNSSSKIQPNMAQIVGWLESGTQEKNALGGTVDYSELTKTQQKYCSSGAVGKNGK